VRLTRGSQDAPATPVAYATLADDGSAEYTFALDWQLSPVPSPAAYAHFHTGSIAAVLEPGGSAVRDLLAAARTHATVSYDPNARPSLMGSPDDARATIEAVAVLADVIKLSDADVEWLYPGLDLSAVLARLGRLGPALVVVTLGPRGARARLTSCGEEVVLPALPTLVVDTVGAGDSFMAGLLSGLLDAGFLGGTSGRARLHRAGIDQITPALERGLASAACTVARAGAHAPTRADLS
jgi:fructokinase